MTDAGEHFQLDAAPARPVLRDPVLCHREGHVLVALGMRDPERRQALEAAVVEQVRDARVEHRRLVGEVLVLRAQ